LHPQRVNGALARIVKRSRPDCRKPQCCFFSEVSVVRGLFADLDPPQNLAPRSDDISEIERQMDRGIR
jgi:hypothetical protein